MPVEMMQQLQDAQMMLVEFIALYASLAACAVLLIWLAGIAYLSHGEMRGQRRPAPAARNTAAASASNAHCLIRQHHIPARSKSR